MFAFIRQSDEERVIRKDAHRSTPSSTRGARRVDARCVVILAFGWITSRVGVSRVHMFSTRLCVNSIECCLDDVGIISFHFFYSLSSVPSQSKSNGLMKGSVTDDFTQTALSHTFRLKT